MENVIIQLVRVLVSPLNKSQRLAASVTLFGLCKGYSLTNVRRLIKQSALETGYWNDYKFLEHNNPFGMLQPSWSQYATGAVGTEGQGVYGNIHQAVIDRYTWDKRNGINPRSKTYLEDVQKAGYNASASYATHVDAFTPDFSGYWFALVLLPTSFVGALYFLR